MTTISVGRSQVATLAGVPAREPLRWQTRRRLADAGLRSACG